MLVSDIKIDWAPAKSQFHYRLCESMIRVGLLEPIILRKSGDKLTVVCGRRRVLAAIDLKWHAIDAFIEPYTEDEAIIARADSNICSIDLSPLARAHEIKARTEAIQRSTGEKLSLPMELARFEGVEVQTAKRALRAAKVIDPEVARRIRGTALESDYEAIEELSRYPSEIQLRAIEKSLSTKMRISQALLWTVREKSTVHMLPSHLARVFGSDRERLIKLLKRLNTVKASIYGYFGSIGTLPYHNKFAAAQEAVDKRLYDILNLIWQRLIPDSLCPDCNGDGCGECFGDGWISKMRASKAEKSGHKIQKF